MQQSFGHREVLASQLFELQTPSGILLQAGAGRAGLGADCRAAGEKERQERNAVDVRRLGHIAIPYGIGVARQASAPEIHENKREVVEDVRTRYLVVELD